MKPEMLIDEYGTKRWKLCDKFHRTDGPAIEYADGGKVWYLYGERHRVDGPAIDDADWGKVWYLYGERHRVDGPAIDDVDSKEWWLHGLSYTFDAWLAETTGLTGEEKVMLKLQYG